MKQYIQTQCTTTLSDKTYSTVCIFMKYGIPNIAMWFLLCKDILMLSLTMTHYLLLQVKSTTEGVVQMCLYWKS